MHLSPAVENKSFHPIRALESTQLQRIKDWYAYGKTDNGIQQILKEKWESKSWISCDCRPRPPLMHIRKVKGRYCIVRMRSHGEHSPECPFSSRPYYETTQKTENAAIHQLNSLLTQWLHKAHLNYLGFNHYGFTITLPFQYRNLHKAAESIMLDDNQSLKDRLVTHPNALHRHVKQWKKMGVGTGYCFVMADRVDKENIYIKTSGQLYTFPMPDTYQVDTVSHTGPWMSLLRLSIEGDDNRDFHIQAAIFKAAYSKSILCPIQPAEMPTIKLIQQMQTEARNANAIIHCEKNLDEGQSDVIIANYHLWKKESHVSLFCISNDSVVPDLPKGALYHQVNKSGPADKTDTYLIQMLKRRLKL